MPTLNTQTPHHFTFESDTLSFHILGGLPAHGLDRMRLTLKVYKTDNEFHALRHNLDLYHSHQVEKFVRKIAEFLEVGTTSVRKDLQELIHELEGYRLSALDKEEELEAEGYLLSKEERLQALRLLKSADLLKKTNRLIGASGVVGEDINRLLMYLIFSSRKTAHPLHCISFGSSGAGKTHLQSKVADLIPEEERIEMTMLSANALIMETLLRKSDPLNGATRNYLETLKSYLKKTSKQIFSNQEVRRELRIAESTLRRYHNLLLQEGFLRKQEAKHGQSFCYELITIDEYQSMEKAIETALKECVEKIQKLAT